MGLQTDMAIHSSIIAWEVPGTDKPGDHGVPKEWDMIEQLNNKKLTYLRNS